MRIGVVKQIQLQERRIPLVPAGAHLLSSHGHGVFIEHEAGQPAGFTDDDYQAAGARIVYSRSEAVGRAELILGVAPVQPEDISYLLPNQILMTFGHLVTLHPETLRGLCEKSITAVAYELIEDDQNRRPIVEVMGEIAGPMAVTMAARFSESHQGGRGVLLSGLPGTPPAHVVVIGGGAVGMAAVRTALGLGAQVTLVDKDPEPLRRAALQFDRRVTTYLSYRYNLERVLPTADVVIGAVWVYGGRPPILITREMVRNMKPGSVIVDCSIDQGGICETGRPTSFADPVYVAERVIHCCIPNMPATVARTASFALANALFPYVRNIAEGGIEKVLQDQPHFGEGIYVRDGRMAHPAMDMFAPDTVPVSY